MLLWFHSSNKEMSNQLHTARHITIQCRERISPGVNKQMDPPVMIIFSTQEENIFFFLLFNYRVSKSICGKASVESQKEKHTQ